MRIWHIFPSFGIVCQVKSGNPAMKETNNFFCSSLLEKTFTLKNYNTESSISATKGTAFQQRWTPADSSKVCYVCLGGKSRDQCYNSDNNIGLTCIRADQELFNVLGVEMVRSMCCKWSVSGCIRQSAFTCVQGDQGSMLWSQFSAIFENFRRKNWRFSQKPMLWSNFCII
jgi:hypothetical protein